MSSLLIRNIEDRTKQLLRMRSAKNGCSMEEEVRSILRSALGVNDNDSENLAESIGKLFKPLGGIELKLPKRGPMREPPTFEKKPKRNRK